MKKRVLFTVHAAVIAALYVVLTLIANALGLANHSIQVRFSEALTILPLFTPAAIPGLFVGCILANFITGCLPWDIICGSIATLLGALGTYFISHRLKQCKFGTPAFRLWKWAATLPPILSNTLIIPFVLSYVYHFEGAIPYFMLTVGLGEIISCGALGVLLYNALYKYRNLIFRM